MRFDVEKLVGAARRKYETREYRGKPARAVILRRAFDTGVDDLWHALTTRERITRWLGPVEGDFRLGGTFALQGNASGEILACEPPRHLAVSWVFAGVTTWVEVTVEAEAERARLELQHISHVGDGEEHWEKFGPGAVGLGWDLGLLGLARHLETGGTPREEPQFDENAPSPELKQFIRAAGVDWADAAIAGGAAEAWAREATARAAGFFAGS